MPIRSEVKKKKKKVPQPVKPPPRLVPKNSRSEWVDHNSWKCLNHLPSIKLPAKCEFCWIKGCSQRPSEEFRPALDLSMAVPTVAQVVVAVTNKVCARPGCGEPTAQKSKYCSRKCTTKVAHDRAKERERSMRSDKHA
jgi:hypothetical protein